MTDNRIEEIKERLAKATPGPWRDGQIGNFRVYGPDGRGSDSGLLSTAFNRENATFIANSPSDIQFLLDEVERLEELVKFANENMYVHTRLGKVQNK